MVIDNNKSAKFQTKLNSRLNLINKYVQYSNYHVLDLVAFLKEKREYALTVEILENHIQRLTVRPAELVLGKQKWMWRVMEQMPWSMAWENQTCSLPFYDPKTKT